jgi:hypothetical protein
LPSGPDGNRALPGFAERGSHDREARAYSTSDVQIAEMRAANIAGGITLWKAMMITFRWHNTSSTELDRKYIALLGVVRLRKVTLLPTFLRFGIRIERQLKRTRGVVGYRTAAHPLSLTFYHLSAWIDADAIERFMETQPHLLAMQKLSGQLGLTVFRNWEIDGSELPLQLGGELFRVRAINSETHPSGVLPP